METLSLWRKHAKSSPITKVSSISLAKRDLNLRKRRWVELLKDYDYMIEYHMGKANVMADALSQKSTENLH